MNKTLRTYKRFSFALILMLLLGTNHIVLSQHEGHKMPAVRKPAAKVQSKRRVATRKKRVSPRRKRVVRRPVTETPHKHPSSTPQPQPSSLPQASPNVAPHQTHQPEVKAPALEQRPVTQPSPPAHDHMPTHPASPTADPKRTDPVAPVPSPKAADPQPHVHKPSATPDSSPTKPTAAEHSGTHNANLPMNSMNMGPLMVMSGDMMSIRVGSSDSNVMPMGQMASGTSWQPASTRMNMLHKSSGEWLLMFHYNAVVGVNSQGGRRGVTKFESANWFMPMAFRKVGPGTLELRGMFSFEPFTFPPGGSPLLFQTGETYKGRPIIDAQHPHDLFMELSSTYTVPIGDRATWFTYFGYPGEPALGPPAFMHRASASENSSAALSHHLQDSSHIVFGVLTTGFTYRWFKLEGSVFNGREPDENRYNFEAHPWTSRSARLSFAPNSNWSMQISHGFLRNPEALEPGDVRRTTASISYTKPLSRGSWATSLIWGRNHESHSGEIFNLNGYVAESTVNFFDKNYLYTRLELVDKNQLLRDEDRLLLGITDHHPSFRIGAYTFGGARDVWTTNKISMAIGTDLTFYSKPAILDPIYGSNPVSWKAYMRFRPGKMDMGTAHGTH